MLFAFSNSFCQATEEMEYWMNLPLDADERKLMEANLADQLKALKELHQSPLNNAVAPAMLFNPIPVGFQMPTPQQPIEWKLPDKVEVPDPKEDLCFYSVAALSQLIKSGQLTSVALTTLYLDRLKRYGEQLHCVVTLLEDRAMQQARKADEEIAKGNYRGPLHGIPYGVKDLLALPGYATTWGANPYKDQYINETATVIHKLDSAGAVLVAKLSMGALAMGDVWYADTTRNPWNLSQGSSGSSAGSASATAAGLVAFSIGTETLGSIVSPATRCGVAGLRPSYGTVSRTGAMALCWSMDKIGPICRTALDCGLVYEVIRGVDGKDPTLYDVPFTYTAQEPTQLKVGYFEELFGADSWNWKNDSVSLEVLRNMGVELIPAALPDSIPIGALSMILRVEAATAFDALTRSGLDTLLVRQGASAWPNLFRSGQFIPAVAYIQANRWRTLLIQKMYRMMKAYDVIVTPTYGGPQLLIANLTGIPCMVVPNGFGADGSPRSISFIGKLFDEGKILALSSAYQEATEFDEQHPPLFTP